jgi:thiamine pyrophosphate-dependent acetolactate synthase large subunit-like protein
MPIVSAHVAHTLGRHIDHVFGVMGNGNAHFLDALHRHTDAIFTAMRHEAGGVVAADAHYRASGRIAAATATYGAGFTNTLTALAESAQARIPLLLVVGDEPTSGPRPWGVDQVALASAVGVRTYTVGDRDATATVLIALEHAVTYRVPVVLAIPYDVVTREAGPLTDAGTMTLPVPLAPRGPAAEATLDRIADALAGAERPFLLAGRGAWLADAGPTLGRLAELTGAITASTALGRGIFPNTAHDLGVTGGFGAAGAMELVREADVAVVFGAGLNQFTMRFGELFAPSTQVFQIDVAPTATHAQVGGFVRADAALAAELLVERLRSHGAVSSGWRDRVDVAPLREQEPGEGLAPDGRLDPRSAAARIAELLPDDRVVVSDGGHFLGWSNMYWPVASPDRVMMVGTAYQSIGLGFPSVAGAIAARPESTVVLTTGDGGGLMALADLESAVRSARGHGIAVVWNDAAYGAEVNLYGLKGLAREPMLIPEVDFAAVARGFGAEGVVVREVADLDALGEWTRRDPEERAFLLLDLRISGTVIAPYQREIIRVNS